MGSKLKVEKSKVFLSIIVVVLISILLNALPIQLNYTSSMPIGLYQRVSTTKIKRGDLVSVCLPKQIAAVALQRSYLRSGSCPSKVTPVLKQVIAIPGDTVILTNSNVTVNGVKYTAPFMPVDHNKKPLQKFISNGLYQHTDGYWIYGTDDPINSWDSRYYGAVNRAAIIGIYKPLLTFKHKDLVKPYPLSATH